MSEVAFKLIPVIALIVVGTLSLRPWLRALPFPSGLSLGIVSAALGLLLGGLFLVFTIIAGIKSAWIAVLGLVAVGVAGHWSQRRLGFSSATGNAFQISPMMQAILLIPVAGLTLIANLKMGLGEFPPVFFNVDTPLYLSQVFGILKSDTYPQESLMMAGAFQPYHYGGPAAAAFVSTITGLAPHKAMFWVVNPLLALGVFFALVTLINSAVNSRFQFLFAFCLFLPAVFLDRELLAFLSSDAPVERLFFNLFGGLFPGSYDAEAFVRDVPGSSVLSGQILLVLSPLLLLTSTRRSFFFLATVIGILAVFTKMDVMPGIFVILGIACLRHASDFSKRSLKLFLPFLGVLILLPPALMYVFGYFDAGQSAQMTTSVRALEDIQSHYDWRWNFAKSHLQQHLIILALFAPLALIWLARRKDQPTVSTDAVFLGLAGLSIVLVTYALVAVAYIPKVGGQLLLPTWISIPLIGLGLLMTCKERLRLLPILLMLPFAFIGAQGQVMKAYHAVVAIVLPENVNEYADNRLIGDALRHIPVTAEDWAYSRYVLSYPDLERAYQASGFAITRSAWGKRHYETAGRREGRGLSRDEQRPMVVTNDFRYVIWSDTQPQIPGLFGHFAYGVHLRHFPGPDGFNIEGARRIDLQRTTLSRDFSVRNSVEASKVAATAKESGWTHFLLRKDLDEGLPPVDTDTIPLYKVYENERYAVYEFSTRAEKYAR